MSTRYARDYPTRAPVGAVKLLGSAEDGSTVNVLASALTPWSDVRRFGAKGDGLTDDTAAIQRALDSLGSAGGIVYLPPLTYRLNGTLTLPSKVTLMGAGRESAVLRHYGAGHAISLPGTTQANRQYCRIERLKVEHVGVPTGDGINAVWAGYSELHDVTIQGFQRGLYLESSWIVRLIGVRSASNTVHGYELGKDANAIWAFGCTAVANASDGWYLSGCVQVSLTACDAEGNGRYGMHLYAASGKSCLAVTINAYLESNAIAEIRVDGEGPGISPTGITLHGCYLNHVAGKAAIGVEVQRVSGLTVDGCTFYCSPSTYDYAMALRAGGAITNVLWGNNFDASAGGVLKEAGTSYQRTATVEG